MPNNGKTIFQNLSSIMGINKPDAVGDNQFLSTTLPGNEVLFATNDKAEYERKLNQYKQEKYLGKALKPLLATEFLMKMAQLVLII